jgi:hypothetical protein
MKAFLQTLGLKQMPCEAAIANSWIHGYDFSVQVEGGMRSVARHKGMTR